MNTVTSATYNSGKIATPITCTLGSTLGNVIHTLSSKSVHRIYVVDGNNGEEVIGVITLRDVISCFVFEPPHFFDNYFGPSGLEEETE